MDDYKRSLYLLARRSIEEYKYTFICNEFTIILLEEGVRGNTQELINELFTEFNSLNDGKYWTPTHYSINKSGAWWLYGWREPRLRILDCILRD